MIPVPLLIALIVVGGIAAHQVLKWAIISWRRAGHCDHRDVVRYWFPKHRFTVWCRRCGQIVEHGRDVTHRYPDSARPPAPR